MAIGILELFPSTIVFLTFVGILLLGIFFVKRKKFFEFFANPKTSIWVDKSKWQDEQSDNQDKKEDKESSD